MLGSKVVRRGPVSQTPGIERKNTGEYEYTAKYCKLGSTRSNSGCLVAGVGFVDPNVR